MYYNFNYINKIIYFKNRYHYIIILSYLCHAFGSPRWRTGKQVKIPHYTRSCKFYFNAWIRNPLSSDGKEIQDENKSEDLPIATIILKLSGQKQENRVEIERSFFVSFFPE